MKTQSGADKIAAPEAFVQPRQPPAVAAVITLFEEALMLLRREQGANNKN